MGNNKDFIKKMLRFRISYFLKLQLNNKRESFQPSINSLNKAWKDTNLIG